MQGWTVNIEKWMHRIREIWGETNYTKLNSEHWKINAKNVECKIIVAQDYAVTTNSTHKLTLKKKMSLQYVACVVNSIDTITHFTAERLNLGENEYKSWKFVITIFFSFWAYFTA